MHAMREVARAAPQSAASLALAWEQLHQIADALSRIARIAPEHDRLDLAAFAELLGKAPESALERAAQGLDDIAAMLAAGMRAVTVVEARGQDAAVPALALWREFHAARAAILALLDPEPTL